MDRCGSGRVPVPPPGCLRPVSARGHRAPPPPASLARVHEPSGAGRGGTSPESCRVGRGGEFCGGAADRGEGPRGTERERRFVEAQGVAFDDDATRPGRRSYDAVDFVEGRGGEGLVCRDEAEEVVDRVAQAECLAVQFARHGWGPGGPRPRDACFAWDVFRNPADGVGRCRERVGPGRGGPGQGVRERQSERAWHLRTAL